LAELLARADNLEWHLSGDVACFRQSCLRRGDER